MADLGGAAVTDQLKSPPCGRAGEPVFAFEGYVRTFDEVPPDVVRICDEYHDANNQVVLLLKVPTPATPNTTPTTGGR